MYQRHPEITFLWAGANLTRWKSGNLGHHVFQDEEEKDHPE